MRVQTYGDQAFSRDFDLSAELTILGQSISSHWVRRASWWWALSPRSWPS
jgi:hypothetical protein